MKTMIETFEGAKRCVDAAQHVLLLTDERSDGDTFGSSLAFSEYLKSEGKQVTHVAGSPVHDALRFLPGIEDVTEDKHMMEQESVDLVIVFDSSRESHVRSFLNRMPKRVPLVVIDHHDSNTLFGDVNVVHPVLSSTCEVVQEYFTHHNIPLTRTMAKCLMTGIMTDTGVLTNPVTNAQAMDRAGTLLNQGGSIAAVVQNIMKNMSVDQLRLWGKMLDRLTYHPALNIATLWVMQSDYAETGTGPEIVGELHDYLQQNMNVQAVFFLKELPNGATKVSMRSRQADMSRIAKFFGGGGHPGACGFTVQGRVKEKKQQTVVA